MQRLEALDRVAEVRGRGLMVGVTLSEGLDATGVADRALAEGLVINVPGPGMLRFLPPLTISSDQLDAASRIIARVID
jgi:acetylornithine aminotransferase